MRNPALVAMSLALVMCGSARRDPEQGRTPMKPIEREQISVTTGDIALLPSGRLTVDSPKLRAVVAHATAPSGALSFHYLGPTRDSAPLDDGEVRTQIGLKLRAQDTCNVVYVMWRIAPEAKLVVSVKHNPGMHTHAQCGARGYRNVAPMRQRPAPRVMPGADHLLQADLKRDELIVYVDGEVVWEGRLGPEVLSFDGPVGVRSDNARFEFKLGAGEPVVSQSH
jgi:hypothetical protein